jgi:ornithine carbamoyltransferase
MKKVKHFLAITDLTKDQVLEVMKISKELKDEIKKTGVHANEIYKNKTMAMIFEKPSLRTRVSFETGMTQLGGHALYLAPSDIGMGNREEPRDVATVLSSMVDVIMARTFKHSTIEDLAKHATVPVINALSDKEHPCQILADFMTIWEKKGTLEGLTLAFVGDGNNNVTHSLALGAALLGMNFNVGAPKGYWMDEGVVKKANDLASKTGVKIMQTDKPEEAVADADVVITDTWVSMGDEAEKEQRLKIFKPYQVDAALMSKAKSDALFMHCLPAYRGNEVSAEVIDGPQSVVFPEAENRLHAQKGLLVWLAQN